MLTDCNKYKQEVIPGHLHPDNDKHTGAMLSKDLITLSLFFFYIRALFWFLFKYLKISDRNLLNQKVGLLQTITLSAGCPSRPSWCPTSRTHSRCRRHGNHWDNHGRASELQMLGRVTKQLIRLLVPTPGHRWGKAETERQQTSGRTLRQDAETTRLSPPPVVLFLNFF